MNLQANTYKLKASSGYTLIEAVIYIAILAVLSVTFIVLLFTMVRAYTDFRLLRDVASSASLSLERMVREARSASGFDPASVFGAHPGRLLLNTADGAGAPTTVDFYLSDGALMVKEGSAAGAAMTVPRVTVDNLVFRQISAAAAPAVKIELTLSASRGAASRSAKFYATAVLRGSY